MVILRVLPKRLSRGIKVTLSPLTTSATNKAIGVFLIPKSGGFPFGDDVGHPREPKGNLHGKFQVIKSKEMQEGMVNPIEK